MKGKRYTAEDKIRLLREGDRGKSILEVCRAHHISEVSFHRWKRQFGQLDLNEARKLKELERENGELEKDARRSPAQEPRLGSGRRKKMAGPAHRRQAAHAVAARGLCSGRAACRILLLSRATFWYQPAPPTSTQQRLAKRLRALSEKHPRYGYRRIAALLRQEGWPVGKRHIQRLRRADGLILPRFGGPGGGRDC